MKKRLTVTNVLLGLLTMAILVQPLVATATHMPADKVVASGEAVEDVEAGAAEVIMSSTFKASKPTDLMVHVTLECSILTRLYNKGGQDVDRSTGEASGTLRVWLEMNGKQVAISQVSSNPQPSDPPEVGKDIDKVTFCNRDHRFTVTDTEQDEDGGSTTCDDTAPGTPCDGTDTYSTYLRTKTANAFNWIILNTGGWGGTSNGIHTLEVWAEFIGRPTSETCADPDPANDNQNCATGFVGNRMLIVEPTKMSNHAVV